jgi:hypothetical protein
MRSTGKGKPTTERYLGSEQDLEIAVNDNVVIP